MNVPTLAPTLVDPRLIDFLLDDVLDVAGLLALPAFAAHERTDIAAMLETAERIARDVFAPCNRCVDDDEPRLENGRVVLPVEIAAALDAFREAGFYAMAADSGAGGLGLPRTVANAAFLWFQAANIAVANYAMLTMSAAELLAQHGTAAHRTRYMTPMLEGRFLGTMALSEPHAGSSLGDITTSASPRPDGTYAIRGTKMWISGGEHDMADNIVHLMLARIEGAEPGVRGLSLFVVPRKRLDQNGRPAIWNNIAIAGLNHKLGQRGTVNTVLNIGEGGETIGEIVGAPGQGLACMFTMMNEARIGVSMGAVAHASAGFLHSLAYARERRQGRLPDGRDPASPQVPLIEHADVRRMLLFQKMVAEGALALGLQLARLADLKHAAMTDQARADAALLLDFLTPVFKAWMSEACLAANYESIQVLGGAGYTRDHPVEQHYRDNRLNPIHEGTNGIQAIDFLGRKTVIESGRAVGLFAARVRSAAVRTTDGPVADVARAAIDGAAALEQALAHLAGVRTREGAAAQLAHSTDVMEIAGATAMCWMWTEMGGAAVARQARLGAADDPAFTDGKLAAGRLAASIYGPRIGAAASRIVAGAPPFARVGDAIFG